MNGVPKYKVIETTTMGETWWIVCDYDVEDQKVNDRHVYGSFTKSRVHAEIFCTLMNISNQHCRNLENT